MYEEMKKWYSEYCEKEMSPLEYENPEAEFDYAYENGQELGLVYSTFDDKDGYERDIEVGITLNPAIERVYVDGDCVFVHRFESLHDLYDSFKGCDWDGIYNWALMYHTEN